MQIIVDQLLTSYRLSGNGKLVVLLHGWGDSSKGSLALQAALAQRFQVLAIDLPGFGDTQAPNTAWGLNEYAVFVQAVLHKLDLSAYAFIGHSNGGAIAIRGIANGTLEAKKLVLLASAGIRNQYNGRKYILRVAARTGKALTMPFPKRIRKKLQSKAYATIGSDMLVAEHLQETFKRIITDDIQADAKRVEVPTLLIYGHDDTATPIQHGTLLSNALPHAELKTIPNAGHFVYLDQPELVIALVEDFLQ